MCNVQIKFLSNIVTLEILQLFTNMAVLEAPVTYYNGCNFEIVSKGSNYRLYNKSLLLTITTPVFV